METAAKFRNDAKIRWYRCQVDPKLMSQLMQCSDYHGYRQALGHLGLWFITGTLAYLAFSPKSPRPIGSGRSPSCSWPCSRMGPSARFSARLAMN